MTKPASDKRKSQLAMIHLAKKQLSLDDETYRAMLHQVSGKTSAADLTADGLHLVLKHLEGLGFKKLSKPKHGRKPKAKPSREALISKIEALLADAGRPWAYADGMAMNMFKVEKLDWLDPDQLWRVAAALSIDAKRRKERGES